MHIRQLEVTDIPRWIEMRTRLWPSESAAELEAQGRSAIAMNPPWVVFVAEEDGALAGFLDLSLRPYADGFASSPVPYVEGWYVDPDRRRRGAGGALMRAAEAWSRARGYTEFGSDTELANSMSREAHAALGFEEAEILVIFRKSLQ